MYTKKGFIKKTNEGKDESLMESLLIERLFFATLLHLVSKI